MNAPSRQVQRILVVDDHDACRYGTARVLRAAGFEILEAATGQEALEKAADQVDLVVLDINLPDIDGYQVCRELRSRRGTSELPVVHLTATFTDLADQDRGLSAGADSFLAHPADPVALVATVRALLSMRDARATKRAANARFRIVFDLAPTGMATFDHELRRVDANAAFARILGRAEPAAATRPTLAELVDPGQDTALDALRTELAAGRTWHGSLRLTRPGGAVSELDWTLTPDPEGNVSIALVIDVTERRLFEARQAQSLASERAARAEAELSNQLKDQFLATLSHELRNPLGAILGWSAVLRSTPGVPAALAPGVEAIERNARIQSHLISDLLDFAGIRFGKMRLDLQTLDPAQTVRAAVDTVRGQLGQKALQLDLRLESGDDALVVADEARLQQIVWNLLTNAIKFTPAGGRIAVDAKPEAGHYRIAVTDSGKGIEPEFLPRLFDRFSQQDSTKAKSFSGLGIGLTIVRHLVELHGGSIEACSDGKDRGSTFRVSIPLQSPADGRGDSLAHRDLSGVKVLVVEDGDDTRALVVRLLTDAGANVAEAATAEAAVQSLVASPSHVLVSDIGMARTDGHALIRRLRADGWSRERLPAVALTAFVREEDRAEALSAGFQLHLGKPVNANALVAAVAQLARPAGNAAQPRQ